MIPSSSLLSAYSRSLPKFTMKGVGAWRSMFSQKDRAVFAEECGELMIELGYEKDQAWVQTSTEEKIE